MYKPWENYYEYLREIPNKGKCGVQVFIYTYGLVVGVDSTGYAGRYCYERKEDAVAALVIWDGVADPAGPWIKYKGLGGERLGPGAIYG